MRTLLLLTLCVSTGALAIKKGDTLYISSKDAVLLKEPKAKAAKLSKLEQWSAVIWNGPSPKDKLFHEVQAGGKTGFVLLTDLSPHRPQLELDSATGKPMATPAFADSGAAGRDGNMGRVPVSRSPADSAVEAELIYVEELNKAKATPAALEAKAKELHGR